jgi:hypothetical protein
LRQNAMFFVNCKPTIRPAADCFLKLAKLRRRRGCRAGLDGDARALLGRRL